MNESHDTIAAVATPPGEGGIGVLRISGPEANHLLEQLLPDGSRDFDPRVATLTPLTRRGADEVLDQGLVTVFPEPRSYTGEDIVEISCHGSPLLLQQLLEDLLEHPEGRMADPGEFTRRAFENGKLDLVQADAVASLIEARSGAALRSSARQLTGELSELIDRTRETLLYGQSRIEAGLDFSDQDSVGAIPFDEIDDRLQPVVERLRRLIDEGERGRLLEQGCFTAIVGRPNVGKSSLLNRLLETDRAIVTETPGTTRDVVAEHAVIEGIPFRLHDTAGIRPDPGAIEAQGIARSKSVLEQADLAVFLLDGSEELTPADRQIHELLDGTPALTVINKIDLERRLDAERVEHELGDPPDCRISVRTGEGLDALRRRMVGALQQGTITVEDPLVTQTRHVSILRETLDAVRRAREGIDRGRDAVLIAEDLREAAEALGRITGDITTEDLLDRIFSSFCIGK